MKKSIAQFCSSVQGSIIIGSVLISLSIILSGAIKIKSQNSLINTVPGTETPAISQPSQPAQSGGRVRVDVGLFPVRGNKNAKVTVIEFADFRCPFCERFFTNVEGSLLKEYIDTGKVKFDFRNFAFLGQQSVWAAEAAECANEQGKFWEYHDWLYQHQASESDLEYYSKANLIKYATNLNLDANQFASCLNSDKYAKQVQDDLSAGQQAGVNGTPTTFINGIAVVGAQPYSAFKTVIDQELAK